MGTPYNCLKRMGGSPVVAARERVLAKAHAAASEIREDAKSLTGAVRDKVLASADEVLDRVLLQIGKRSQGEECLVELELCSDTENCMDEL